MVEIYNMESLVKKGKEILGEREFMNTSLEVELILSHILKKDRSYIIVHNKEILEETIVEKFLRLIELRKKGIPIQYILNSQEFMGLDFYVKEGVLIPRGETELLVEHILDLIEKNYPKEKTVRILEVGTGSGAIPISIAYYTKNTEIYTVDIEEIPYNVAKENCKRYGLENRIKFLLGDLFEPIRAENTDEKFDIIVSNPPYIKKDEIEKLQIEVREHEPKSALDGGIDGLDFYRKIILKSCDFLVRNGILAFEIGYDQGEEVVSLMNENFKEINLIKDYSGLDRIVLGVKK